MDLNHNFIGNSLAKNLIIFLHEGLGSIQQWRQFPNQVCAENDCYGLVYDRRGYGKSPGNLVNRTKDYLHEGADELAGVIAALPNQYQIILYGHSDGGSIALIYASMFPHSVKAIITEAAHVIVEEQTIAGVKAAKAPFLNGKFKGLEKYHGARFKEVFLAWNDIWQTAAFANWSITEILPKITCPQLIIQGEDDEYGTVKQVERIESLTTGRSKRFIPKNCGHAPHKEKQKETLSMVNTFLNELN